MPVTYSHLLTLHWTQLVSILFSKLSGLMASSSDALLALKAVIASDSPVQLIASDGSQAALLSASSSISLGSEATFPKTTPTRLRKPGTSSTNPVAVPGDFYTLESVYLAWLARDASGAEYLKQAREAGLATGFVSVTERSRLVEWLKGASAEHDGIVPISGLNCFSILPYECDILKVLARTIHYASWISSSSCHFASRYCCCLFCNSSVRVKRCCHHRQTTLCTRSR